MPRALVLVPVIVLGLIAPAAMSAENVIGSVISARNDVWTVSSGRQTPLRVGDPIRIGQVVRTGTGSEATISLNGASKLYVGPTATVTIDDGLYNSALESRFVRLIKSAFRLFNGIGRTPQRDLSRDINATIAVRG